MSTREAWTTSKSCRPCGAAETNAASSSGAHSAANKSSGERSRRRGERQVQPRQPLQTDPSELLEKLSTLDGLGESPELLALQRRAGPAKAEAKQAKLLCTPPEKSHAQLAQ